MIGETGERKSAVATPDGKSRKKKKKTVTEKGPDFELIFKTFVPKCVCLRVSAPDPAGGAYSAPRPPAGKGWVTHQSVPLTFLSGSTPLR